jgi:hypothetical protein
MHTILYVVFSMQFDVLSSKKSANNMCSCTALLKAEFFIEPRRTHSGKEDEEKEE